MKPSRRSFLEAGLALPAVLGSSPSLLVAGPTSEAAPSKDSSFDPWVEIHRENLRHNVHEISPRSASPPILTVIKNNGYSFCVATAPQPLQPHPSILRFSFHNLP